MSATCAFSARPKPVTCTFTVAGGKACTGRPACGPGQQDHAAHVAEHEGAAGVDGVEEVLDGEDVGAEAGDERGDARVDEVQALGEAAARRRGEHALLEQAVAAAVGLDGAVAGAQGAGVDAEDDHAARRV